MGQVDERSGNLGEPHDSLIEFLANTDDLDQTELASMLTSYGIDLEKFQRKVGVEIQRARGLARLELARKKRLLRELPRMIVQSSISRDELIRKIKDFFGPSQQGELAASVAFRNLDDLGDSELKEILADLLQLEAESENR